MRARAGAAAAPAAGERLFPLSLCSFENVRAEKYPDTLVPELGLTARQHMAQVLNTAKYYAAHFPRGRVPACTCSAARGLGKHILPSPSPIPCCKRAATWCMSARRTRLTPSNASASPPARATPWPRCKARSCLFWTTSARSISSPYVNSCLYSLVNTRVPPPAHHLHQQHRQRRRPAAPLYRKGGFPPAGQLRNTVLLRHRYPASWTNDGILVKKFHQDFCTKSAHTCNGGTLPFRHCSPFSIILYVRIVRYCKKTGES